MHVKFYIKIYKHYDFLREYIIKIIIDANLYDTYIGDKIFIYIIYVYVQIFIRTMKKQGEKCMTGIYIHIDQYVNSMYE